MILEAGCFSEKEPPPFPLPSPWHWPCVGLLLLHRDNLLHEGSHSPAASLPHWPLQQLRGKSSSRWGQPCLGHLCSQHQGQLLSWDSFLFLSRRVTHSQMPLGLEANILHLPPAHDPVPVLDYPRLLHFFHLPLAGQAEAAQGQA